MRLSHFIRLRTFSLSLFVVGLVTASVIYYSQSVSTVGFEMIQNRTFFPDGKNAIRYAESKKFQTADGTSKEVTTYYDMHGTAERVDVQLREPGRGLFKVNETTRTLNLISPLSPVSPSQTRQRIRNDPNFNREEYVLGHKTLVLHIPHGNGDYLELYYAPILDAFIKSVSKKKQGLDVTEPTAIILGDLDNSLFGAMQAYPIVHDLFNGKIEHAEKTGNSRLVQGLRRQLEDFNQSERTKTTP